MGYVPGTANVNAAAIMLVILLWAWAPAAASPPLRLLVLGDSLTAGYGLNAEDGFTARLQAALKAEGRDVTVLNAGVSGDTTAVNSTPSFRASRKSTTCCSIPSSWPGSRLGRN